MRMAMDRPTMMIHVMDVRVVVDMMGVWMLMHMPDMGMVVNMPVLCMMMDVPMGFGHPSGVSYFLLHTLAEDPLTLHLAIPYIV
jgi:hypothetical protein